VKFDHVNIVRGYDNGMANTLYYLAMEYIEGKSVQNMIDEGGSLKEEQALDIILQIARALAYIQEQGIVHRDVKPDNVLMTPDGVVKLCDLGFAKPLGGHVAGAATEDVTCGTPQYMSPEQAQGEAALDIRSDIYALGATLYHMALGTLPFKGTDNMEIMAKQVLESLDSAEVKSRKISKHMHYFIERMMSKDKDFRYQSPQEMVEDIETQMEGWRTLQFNPDEVETSLDGFLTKPMHGQPTTRKSAGQRQPPDRPSTHFLRRKP
jgi:serine/threonine-protein kinase